MSTELNIERERRWVEIYRPLLLFFLAVCLPLPFGSFYPKYMGVAPLLVQALVVLISSAMGIVQGYIIPSLFLIFAMGLPIILFAVLLLFLTEKIVEATIVGIPARKSLIAIGITALTLVVMTQLPIYRHPGSHWSNLQGLSTITVGGGL